MLAVSLFVLVSLLGFLTLTRGFSRDLWLLLFCHVMASCQYSLLKARPRPRPRPAPAPCTPKAPDGDPGPSALCSRASSRTPPRRYTYVSPETRSSSRPLVCKGGARPDSVQKAKHIRARVR